MHRARAAALAVTLLFKLVPACRDNALCPVLASNVLFIALFVCAIVAFKSTFQTKKCLFLQVISQIYFFYFNKQDIGVCLRCLKCIVFWFFFFKTRSVFGFFLFFQTLFVFPTCSRIIILDSHPVKIASVLSSDKLVL